MKTLRFLLFATTIAFFSACSDDKNEEENEQGNGSTTEPTEIIYIVNTSVGGETPYAQENVSILIDKKATEIDMKMQKVKFAERMPEMDITIPGVAMEGTTLSGNEIIPLAMGGEFPTYTITNLTGTMTGESISVEMNCGKYPLSFSGTLKKE